MLGFLKSFPREWIHMISIANKSKENLDRIKSENKSFFHKTNFSFLKEHNGFRNGAMHLLLGSASGGKSTLRNTLMIDFLEANKEKIIFLYLSEETLLDFERDLADCEKLRSVCDRIKIFSEQDSLQDVSMQNEKASFLVDQVAMSGCDLFIFDNITTSILYGEDFKTQGQFVLDLKARIQLLGIPVLVVAHTGAAVKTSGFDLIDQNDIRGSKTIVNISQFLYVMQTFAIQDHKVTTVRITKHRSFDVDNHFFMLRYKKEDRVYIFDLPLTFEEVNELYKKQNRLTRNGKTK